MASTWPTVAGRKMETKILTFCTFCRKRSAQTRTKDTLPKCAECFWYIRWLYCGEIEDENYADHLIRRAHYNNRHVAARRYSVRLRELRAAAH